jgi:hypothetical protein
MPPAEAGAADLFLKVNIQRRAPTSLGLIFPGSTAIIV